MKSSSNLNRTSFSHIAPDSMSPKILFFLRILFDLQISSVYSHLKKTLPSFKGRVLDIGCG
jgi:hypothetical protein